MAKSKRGRTQAEELGNRVRSAREDAHLSQEKLGEKANMHRTYIGHLERGEVNPTLYSIVVIAHALGRDPGEFVTGILP